MAKETAGERKLPTTKEEAIALMLEIAQKGMADTCRKHGYKGHVERRGNLIVSVWDDRTEDVYEVGVEFMQ